MALSLNDISLDQYVRLSKSDPNLIEQLHRSHDEQIQHEQLNEEDDYIDYPSYPSSPPESTEPSQDNINIKPNKIIIKSKSVPLHNSDKPNKIIVKSKSVQLHNSNELSSFDKKLQKKMDSDIIQHEIIMKSFRKAQMEGGQYTDYIDKVENDIKIRLSYELK